MVHFTAAPPNNGREQLKGLSGPSLRNVNDIEPLIVSVFSVFRTVKSYWIAKGNSFSTTVTKQETELTPEMIAKWVQFSCRLLNTSGKRVPSALLCLSVTGCRTSDRGHRESSAHKRGRVQRWGLCPKGRAGQKDQKHWPNKPTWQKQRTHFVMHVGHIRWW